ncbi:hypothetical protein [Aliikangiella coralliicola]|uniref:Uncharacterized protein n=1 Tax=Aliikangiella coralliicola TaxID=2592383 RepID=A0A545U949_9GAMM|nr:hypothetical protein [Aliikangiella coralliicola]TQV85933.1 hypothetical protein FLL46_18620 [Aliikangiella coralliicola]
MENVSEWILTTNTKKYNSEMQLFDQDGNRLYLTAQEKALEERLFCFLVHYTGCCPTEALELTAEKDKNFGEAYKNRQRI